MAERVPPASELSRIMERVACEVTRHVGQLELRPVLDENFPAETGRLSSSDYIVRRLPLPDYID